MESSKYSFRGILRIFAMFTLFGVIVGYLMALNPGIITPGVVAWFNQMDYAEQELFMYILIFIVTIMCYLGIRRYTIPYQEGDDINGD